MWILAAAFLANCIHSPAADLHLSVAPASRLVFDDYEITVSDAVPGEKVTIEVTLTDENEVTWRSRGVYYADAGGRVDVATAASIGGTYRGVDDTGLIRSMLPPDLGDCLFPACVPATAPRTPSLRISGATSLQFAAHSAASPSVVAATQSMEYMARGVMRQEIADGGLQALLFEPPGKGPFPAVVYLTGSNGAIEERTPALLASQGFAVLSVAYFGRDGLPPNLMHVPLEYFRDAMDFMRSRYNAERVALSGLSRGAEAALLVASSFPDRVAAVVAGVPSNVVWAGCCGADNAFGASWTLAGEAILGAPLNVEELPPVDAVDRSPSYRRVYLDAMRHPNEEFVIPVEHIGAPIMLISAEADEVWPSSITAAALVRRLAQHDYPHAVEHRHTPGAGHGIVWANPVSSLADEYFHPMMGSLIRVGGNPEGNAMGARDAYSAQLHFLQKTMAPAGQRTSRRGRCPVVMHHSEQR